MPIRDTAAMNASLDNDYGATHGPNAPDAHDLALFDGDPMVDGTELDSTTAPGYARASIDNDASWTSAVVDDVKTTVAPVQFADADDAWVEASHWGLFDGSVLWDCGPLTEALEVTAAGAGPAVSPVVFYDESAEPPG